MVCMTFCAGFHTYLQYMFPQYVLYIDIHGGVFVGKGVILVHLITAVCTGLFSALMCVRSIAAQVVHCITDPHHIHFKSFTKSFHYLPSPPAAPIVTAISPKDEVTSPAPVSFNCTVDSYPPSNITWLHNGAEVQAAPPRVTISTVQVDNRTQESTLTLLNTTAEDIGTYTCSAVNGVGSTNRTTELLVLGELR